jgi:uncharacterized membrane protein
VEEHKETGRIEAFSDGVFAVAITLLVLNLQPPKPLQQDLLGWLGQQWPAYLAFVTSFATIGVMWINHHRLFTYITRSDSTLMALNLLLMMLIVFVPFPTALLAGYIAPTRQQFTGTAQQLAGDQLAAALLFNGTYVLLAFCFNALWRYSTNKNRLLGKDADREAVQGITKQYRWGPVYYIISFGLAWLSVPASIGLNLLMGIYFALPARKPRPIEQAE